MTSLLGEGVLAVWSAERVLRRQTVSAGSNWYGEELGKGFSGGTVRKDLPFFAILLDVPGYWSGYSMGWKFEGRYGQNRDGHVVL